MLREVSVVRLMRQLLMLIVVRMSRMRARNLDRSSDLILLVDLLLCRKQPLLRRRRHHIRRLARSSHRLRLLTRDLRAR